MEFDFFKPLNRLQRKMFDESVNRFSEFIKVKQCLAETRF